MRYNQKLFLVLLFSSLSINTFARSQPTAVEHLTAASDPLALAWMTGPLLAPAGHTVPAGHTNWEPYIFVNNHIGRFGRHGQVLRTPQLIIITPEMVVTQGITNLFDFEAVIPYTFKTRKGQYYSASGDIQLILGFQALTQSRDWWHPDLRMTLGMTAPTGNYQNLNPTKLGTDVTGAGSNQVSFGGTFQRLVLIGKHFLRWRLSLLYAWLGKVHVAGFNAYGGGVGTLGVVSPGNTFSVDAGFEFALTPHWVPALDITYTTAKRNTFSGVKGVLPNGDPALNPRGRAQLYTLAPAIEYNFNEALGLIAGVWFSVKGVSKPDFVSAVVALNYYI